MDGMVKSVENTLFGYEKVFRSACVVKYGYRAVMLNFL